jgi:hypothetical protein
MTLWSRVLLEKLIGPQIVVKFSAFFGTRRFITPLQHILPNVPILIQINPVHTTPSQFLQIHFNIIFPSVGVYLNRNCRLVFQVWNTETVGSNPVWGMAVCLCRVLCSVYVRACYWLDHSSKQSKCKTYKGWIREDLGSFLYAPLSVMHEPSLIN